MPPKHPSRRDYLSRRETRNTWLAALVALALGSVAGDYAGRHVEADLAGRIFWLVSVFSFVATKVVFEWRYLKVGTTVEMERAGLSNEEINEIRTQWNAFQKANKRA